LSPDPSKVAKWLKIKAPALVTPITPDPVSEKVEPLVVFSVKDHDTFYSHGLFGLAFEILCM